MKLNKEKKMIAGVCAGLADHFGMNLTLIRLGFVVSLFFSGIGILAYIILWILMAASTE